MESECLLYEASNYRETEAIKNPKMSCATRLIVVGVLVALTFLLLQAALAPDMTPSSFTKFLQNQKEDRNCPTCVVSGGVEVPEVPKVPEVPEGSQETETQIERDDTSPKDAEGTNADQTGTDEKPVAGDGEATGDDNSTGEISEIESSTRVLSIKKDEEGTMASGGGETQDRLNKSIFFVVTTRFDNNYLMLKPREACAIESAAKNNPTWSVVVYALDATTSNAEGSNAAPLKEYPNIQIVLTTLPNLVALTPAAEWGISGPLHQSQLLTLHRSDLLRFVVLWKYGGVYLDTDLITLKSFDTLPPNFAVAFDAQWIDAAVMSFTSNGFGHHLTGMLLSSFMKSFKPERATLVGPKVLTDVGRELCSTSNTSEMSQARCFNFEVLPQVTFYPISPEQVTALFDEKIAHKVLGALSDSYGVHLWAGTTSKYTMKVGGKAALGLLAEQHCPKVYKSCGSFF